MVRLPDDRGHSLTTALDKAGIAEAKTFSGSLATPTNDGDEGTLMPAVRLDGAIGIVRADAMSAGRTGHSTTGIPAPKA